MRLWILFAAALVLGRAQEPPVIHVDVSAVTVAVSVTGRNGAPVKNLHREDFSILDDGQPRDIQSFWQETDLPLTIGLIVDVSGSQFRVIEKHRETIRRFLAQVMSPQDRAFLVTVGRQVRLVRDFTHSIEELRAGVDEVRSRQPTGILLGEPCRGISFRNVLGGGGCGGTALWNGVYAAAELKMKPVAGRKALIVLSDGEDTGSTHSLTDAIEAAQSADTLVYTVRYLGNPLSIGGRIAMALKNPMKRLSEETGGQAYSSRKNAAEVFTEIESELRNLYILGFTPPEEARDGKFHRLQVKVPQADGSVRTRQGYVAPGQPRQ